MPNPAQLTPQQESLIALLPEDGVVHIRPFDMKAREAAARLMINLRTALPRAQIHHLGGTRLGIAGEQAIDIVIVDEKEFKTSAAALESFFGTPEVDVHNDGVLRWKCPHGGFPVHIFLAPEVSPRLNSALDIEHLLESRGDLRAEYERLKFSCDGMSAREYARRKFEFFNAVLHR